MLLNNNGLDVKVLMGRDNLRKYYFYYAIKEKFIKPQVLLDSTYLSQGVPSFSFLIPQYINATEERNYRALCITYALAYQELIKSGWIPDIIHAQSTVNAGLVAHHLNKKFKIPFVIIEHQIFNIFKYSLFMRPIIKKALIKANKIGAVSHHQKRNILMSAIDKPIDIIWNLVDEDKFNPISDKKKDKFTISTITYPLKVKDVETFFKSVAAFIHTNIGEKNINIVVVGNCSFDDGPKANTDYYEKLAKDLEILDYCTFKAYMSSDEVVNLLSKTDVFVLTSISETFGIVVREAMLCGATVISTKNGGVEDSVNHKTGILVDIGDYKSIANNLNKIYRGLLSFDLAYNRNFIIKQSGKKAFLSAMKRFYNN